LIWGRWRAAAEGGGARQHDVRWGRSLCDSNAYIADFLFYMLYILFSQCTAIPTNIR